MNSWYAPYFSGGECENPIETISGNEKIAFVEEWLASQAGLSSDPSYHSHGLKLDVQSDESDEEVDVVSSNISPSKGEHILRYLRLLRSGQPAP